MGQGETAMNNWIFWIFIATLVFGPLIYSASTLWKLFLGWRSPITWISALPVQGWVEVTGRVKGVPIKSLLNQSDCAYWQLEVKEYQSSGRGGGRWRTLHKQSSGNIEVDDMTGRIKIQDRNSDLVLKNDTVLENLDESMKASLQKLGIKTRNFLGFNRRLRIYERLLAPEEEILVLGKVQKNESAISITPGSIDPLVITNLSKPEMMKALFVRSIRPMIIPYLIGLAFLAFLLYTTIR
jgi:hypothetical protein